MENLPDNLGQLGETSSIKISSVKSFTPQTIGCQFTKDFETMKKSRYCK